MPANFCTHCGEPVAASALFCVQCGTPLQQEAQPPVMQPVAAPAAKHKKKRKITLIIAGTATGLMLLLIILGVVFGGDADEGFYMAGGERIASVGAALGGERTIHSAKTSAGNGVETCSVVYNTSDGRQGADMRAYLAYLCDRDGFAMRSDIDDTAFYQATGSAIQAWRNAREPGHMVVAQVDYDTKGYTITLMYGMGQVDGGTAPVPPPGGGGEPVDTSSLLPSGKPSSTSSVNGLDIAVYKDDTVSVQDGQVIIQPDGTVYINGYRKQSKGSIQIPQDGSSITIGGGSVHAVDGEYYIIANGSVVYIDAESTASAWDAP